MAIKGGFADKSSANRWQKMLYLGGFAPEFEKFSPGTVLIGQAIGEAIAAGDLEADFLRGSEAYKYTWCGVDRMTYRVTIGPDLPNPPSRIKRRIRPI